MTRSIWFAAVVATLLGAATCAGVMMLRWHQIVVEETASQSTGHSLSARERGWDFWSGEIDTLSADLKKERQELDTRSKDLDALALRLAAEKQELVRVRTEIEGMRAEISREVPVLQADEKVNLKTLSKAYSTMKPRQTVTILGEMDDSSVVKLLATMKPDVVGAILEEMATAVPGGKDMSPRAAKLSEQLRLLKQEGQTSAQ